MYFYIIVLFLSCISNKLVQTNGKNVDLSSRKGDNFHVLKNIQKYKISKRHEKSYCFYEYIKCFNLAHHQDGTIKIMFNDPGIINQWYFFNSDPWYVRLSHDLDKIWATGILGYGVSIGIVGDGIDISHMDLQANHLRRSSRNFFYDRFENKIYSSYSASESTNSAGLISAVANNRKCGVGAAPLSKFSSLQIYKDDTTIVTTMEIAKAISFEFKLIDIYLLNLKFDKNIKLGFFKSINLAKVLEKGSKTGRKYLGNLFIMGSGNQRTAGNNCAFNGLLQNKHVYVFGAVSSNGSPVETSERCYSILAASLGSESNSSEHNLYTTSNGHACSHYINGSVAAASISAGILALLVSANTRLTVRQILFMIVLTSIQYDVYSISNTAGFLYSNSSGFGMLYAAGLIEFSMSNDITIIAEEHICTTNSLIANIKIYPGEIQTIYMYTTGCADTDYCVTEIEHLFILFTINILQKNSLSIKITSPGGTIFPILIPRYYDIENCGFYNWKLKVMGYFGENPLGVWKIDIYSSFHIGRIRKIELTFHGTCVHPFKNIESHNNIKNYVFSGAFTTSSNLISKFLQIKSAITLRRISGIDGYSFIYKDFPSLMFINTLT